MYNNVQKKMGFTPHKNVKIWGFQKVVTSSKKNHKNCKIQKNHKITINCNKNLKIWGLPKVVTSSKKNP